MTAPGCRLRAWLPEGKPRAVILALHGFNDYSNAFDKPGKEWAKHGVATYAYDQRGFGRAPDRGRWAGAWRLDTDLAEASRLLRARYPGVPLFMLGESMGGAVVITAVAGTAGAPKPICDGIVLVAPAVWGRVTMSVFERVALWAGDALFPGLELTGRRPQDHAVGQRADAARAVARSAGDQGDPRRYNQGPRRSDGSGAGLGGAAQGRADDAALWPA